MWFAFFCVVAVLVVVKTFAVVIRVVVVDAVAALAATAVVRRGATSIWRAASRLRSAVPILNIEGLFLALSETHGVDVAVVEVIVTEGVCEGARRLRCGCGCAEVARVVRIGLLEQRCRRTS